MGDCSSITTKKHVCASDLTVSILQATPGRETALERLQYLTEAVTAVAASNTDILVCPELFLCGYNSERRARDFAEAGDGPFAATVANLAKQAGIAIAYGYPELADGVLYNSARVVGAEGEFLQNYRKCHLPMSFERECFQSSNQLGTFSLKGVTCSCIICYDVEFPEMVRKLAKNGVQLLLVPTALGTRWRIVAEKMVPTRALENGIYIAYANYAGKTDQRDFAGLSCLVGPGGQEIFRGSSEPELLTGKIETSCEIKSIRQIQYMEDVRDDIICV